MQLPGFAPNLAFVQSNQALSQRVRQSIVLGCLYELQVLVGWRKDQATVPTLHMQLVASVTNTVRCRLPLTVHGC